MQLESFDKAWQLINDRYWDPEFGGLDWASVKDELRPEAAAAETNEELRSVLNRMIERLGQSHFGVLPGSSEGVAQDVDGEFSDDARCTDELRQQLVARIRSTDHGGGTVADPGLVVGFVDGEVYVTRVDEGGPAAREGVEPGSQVLSVDSVPLNAVPSCFGEELDTRTVRSLVMQAVTGLLAGHAGDQVKLVLRTGSEERTLDLARRVPDDIETVKFGNLPEIDVRFSVDWREGIAVVRFNFWMIPIAQMFENLALQLPEAQGLIIDLRGNPGGVAGLAPGVAGYLLDEKHSLGTLRYRTTSLELVAMPRKVTRSGKPLETFHGPVALLIDAQTASTSEIFAASLQDLGRARLFGERSMGAALPAVIEELPNGDFLMHALADLLRPNGGRIEGLGVSPDQAVEVTVVGLRAGRDEVFLAALAWVSEQAAQGVESKPQKKKKKARAGG